jgi:hypothetical protein
MRAAGFQAGGIRICFKSNDMTPPDATLAAMQQTV